MFWLQPFSRISIFDIRWPMTRKTFYKFPVKNKIKCESLPENNLERSNYRKYKEYTKDNLHVKTRSNFLGVKNNYNDSHTINASPLLNRLKNYIFKINSNTVWLY